MWECRDASKCTANGCTAREKITELEIRIRVLTEKVDALQEAAQCSKPVMEDYAGPSRLRYFQACVNDAENAATTILGVAVVVDPGMADNRMELRQDGQTLAALEFRKDQQ